MQLMVCSKYGASTQINASLGVTSTGGVRAMWLGCLVLSEQPIKWNVPTQRWFVSSLSFHPFHSSNFSITFCFLLFFIMSGHDNEELIDYEEDHDVPNVGASAGTNGAAAGASDSEGKDKKNFSGIHSTGFRSAFCNFTSHSMCLIFYSPFIVTSF